MAEVKPMTTQDQNRYESKPAQAQTKEQSKSAQPVTPEIEAKARALFEKSNSTPGLWDTMAPADKAQWYEQAQAQS